MLTQTCSEAANDSVRLDYLRKAIRDNRVSFPAQVPIFACQHRVEIQWRLVALYFVQGWSAVRIARRYKVTSRRVQQLLRQWVTRARMLGYLQEIPTETACEVPALSAPHLHRELEIPVLAGIPLSDLPESVRAAAARQE
jgi:hypothetical protein